MNPQFLENFKALRRCFIRSLIGMAAVTAALLPFTKELFSLAGAPLLKALPQGTSLLAVGVISPVMGPLKLVLFVAFAVSLPWVLWQLWQFVAPGLYKKEKKSALIFVISSLCMFAAGTAYCYFVVFNFLFPFIASFAPQSISFAPDVESYISFMLHMFVSFGLAFETPVALCFLICFDITSPETLKLARRYIIVGAFALPAVLSPPDVTSQLLLALPLIALFEAGMMISTLLFRSKKRQLQAINS